MTNLTKFVISDTQYLKINPECIHDDDCKFCAEIDIDYVDEENNLCIRFGYQHASSIYYKIAESAQFQHLIDGKKTLDLVVENDPGFEWNQYYEGLIADTDVLEKYHCWSNSHKQIPPYFNSWMYNNQNGDVIFEITPFYPFHHETKKTHPGFVTYKKWIKDYKPTVITTIPKENLKQWIIQAKELEKIYFPEFAEK